MPFVEAIFGMEVGEEYNEQMELVWKIILSVVPEESQTYTSTNVRGGSRQYYYNRAAEKTRTDFNRERCNDQRKAKVYPDKVPVPEVPSDDEESSENQMPRRKNSDAILSKYDM